MRHLILLLVISIATIPEMLGQTKGDSLIADIHPPASQLRVCWGRGRA